MRTVIVIPARYASSRFPGKVIHPILGRPMLWYVWNAAIGSGVGKDNVFIAVDNKRVEEVCRGFGARTIMTPVDCNSGSDRVGWVVKDMDDVGYVVNLQADEPLLPQDLVSGFLDFVKGSGADMASVYTHLKGNADDPNIVKVVMDESGNAMYFSRSAIPFYRDCVHSQVYYQHIGIYAYRRDFLLRFLSWPKSRLEDIEKLEQLRALEKGVNIKMFYTDYRLVGVDTPEDVAEVEALMREKARE